MKAPGKCRYYKGEETCPESWKTTRYEQIWNYERSWSMSEDLRKADNHNMEMYNQGGLLVFNQNDGVPVTLKALLFARYVYWSGSFDKEQDAINFKRWYLEKYLGS